MPNLPPRYNWGSSIKNINTALYNQLSDSYTSTATIVNGKINRHISTADPQNNANINASYDLGDIWVNTNNNTAWIMTSRQTQSQVIWTQIT